MMQKIKDLSKLEKGGFYYFGKYSCEYYANLKSNQDDFVPNWGLRLRDTDTRNVYTINFNLTDAKIASSYHSCGRKDEEESLSFKQYNSITGELKKTWQKVCVQENYKHTYDCLETLYNEDGTVVKNYKSTALEKTQQELEHQKYFELLDESQFIVTIKNTLENLKEKNFSQDQVQIKEYIVNLLSWNMGDADFIVEKIKIIQPIQLKI